MVRPRIEEEPSHSTATPLQGPFGWVRALMPARVTPSVAARIASVLVAHSLPIKVRGGQKPEAVKDDRDQNTDEERCDQRELNSDRPLS